jgi:hypothetical protein
LKGRLICCPGGALIAHKGVPAGEGAESRERVRAQLVAFGYRWRPLGERHLLALP